MDLSRAPSIINKARGPEITLTNEEKHVYSQLFQVADEDNKGIIYGSNAVKLFGKSGLDQNILRKIWQLADSENKGFLTKQTFSVAVKLIAQAQNGQSFDPSKINADAPLPRFEGINIEPYQKLSSPEKSNVITNEDREKYKDMFYKLNPVNGILDGEKAKGLFERSKLPFEKLSQIWSLADTKMRGQFDLPEFIIAMHFIQQTMKGAITTLPTELPIGFYEMALGSTPTSPQTFPRNLSSPLPGQSPKLNSISTPPIFQSWDVTENDKASYDRLFDGVDENKRGYITGDEAANFFMKSKLGQDQLARIWDLASINKSGSLNRDEFAVAMYLITKKMAGVPLPDNLPLSLIPPSMRSVAVNPLVNLNRSATLSNRSHSSQLSEPDSFFDSLRHTASPGSFFSSTTSQPGSEFDLLGDTDISTKIALESGEINNYKLQSESLNNATTDLKSNRAKVESSISSLVTQKQDMMTQLSQIRTLYESEAKSMREIQAKYDLEHESVERIRQELLQAENALRALQLERDQLNANTQKDREETLDIKRRIRIAEEETVSIKAEIEKLKKDGRQQKGFLAINRKQLMAAEGEKEKAFKILQSFEDKDVSISSQDVNDPFGTGAFTPLAFNPSNTTSGITTPQPTTDFNESGNIQKSSIHSQRGSLSSIGEFGVKRSMSNASIASNSTLGTSSIKSAPLNSSKPEEPSFDKPITVASSKPSEFENFFSDQVLSTSQQITTNANVAESNKVANPFDSTLNDPFGGISNDQTNIFTQNHEENMTQQDIVKEDEKSEADDPFANLNDIPTSEKPSFDSAFDASNNDNLSSDSFTKEFPTIEEIEASVSNVSSLGFENNFTNLANDNHTKEVETSVTNESNLGFNDFTSLATNNQKKDLIENNSLIQNTLPIETTETMTINNIDIKNDDKGTSNTPKKETESTFSIVTDPTESWVSIESSATKSNTLQDDFAFGDLTEAKVTKTPPPIDIEFDTTGFDDFEDSVNFTFDAPTTSAKPTSINNNNTTISSTTSNFADFDKNFDDFDPFSPSTSSNKPKANLDAAFGGISAETSNFGFDDAFAELVKPSPSSTTDKQSTAITSTKSSTSSRSKLQQTNPTSATDDDAEDVKKIIAMGYSREMAVNALERNNYDFEKSVNYLLE